MLSLVEVRVYKYGMVELGDGVTVVTTMKLKKNFVRIALCVNDYCFCVVWVVFVTAVIVLMCYVFVVGCVAFFFTFSTFDETKMEAEINIEPVVVSSDLNDEVIIATTDLVTVTITVMIANIFHSPGSLCGILLRYHSMSCW